MNTKKDIIRQILGDRHRKPLAIPQAETFAPANIALCKYWGKRDTEINLPVTDSLSISLGQLGSRCRISLSDNATDQTILNGVPLPAEHPFARRLSLFLDAFRDDNGPFYRVDAHNTIPTAAGFASSASGFASLVMALNQLHGWQLDDRDLSILARLGSGSACRSIWQGFVHWHAGSRPDGMDSHAAPLAGDWPELRIGLLILEGGQKGTGSTEAMRRTVETSALYAAWPTKVEADLADIRQAILTRDFERLGETAESNALAMHATMMAARPPVVYWQPASIAAMHTVWTIRREGVPVYFTMDAGPNIKLIFLQHDRAALSKLFPSMIVADRQQESSTS